MSKVFLLLTLLLADEIDTVVSQYPCNSPLRLFRPDLFTHCKCYYGPWSKWKRINENIIYNSTNCQSGYLHRVRRTRKDTLEECDDEVQMDYHCAPTVKQMSQIMIEILDLKHPLKIESPLKSLQRSRKRKSDELDMQPKPGCIRETLGECKKGRRHRSNVSPKEAYTTHEVSSIQMDDGVSPKPFSVDEYLSRFRKHRHARSLPIPNKQIRYALFILDGSGSIGSYNFERMKNFTKYLGFAFQYCGSTAVMVYDQCVYLEYDFNCYKNDEHLGQDFLAYIDKIPYPQGNTASGYAIEMAFTKVLNKTSRGINVNQAAEVDVIFITDGHSNVGDSPCVEANIYWKRIQNKVHVFPIGIGSNFNVTELDCIMGDSPEVDNPMHVLNFEMLESIQEEILKKLSNDKNFCAQYDDFQEIVCEFAYTNV